MRDIDLYEVDLTGLAGRRMCGGNTGDKAGENESCAVLVGIPGMPGAVALSDSKDPQRAALRFTGAEMEALVTGYAREHRITL